MKFEPTAPRCSARALTAAMLVATLLAAACSRTVSTTSDDSRPMPPAPRTVAPPPAGSKANAVAIQVAPKPRDTNGNGYPDLIDVAGYLFSEPHEMPLYEDGAFVFLLFLDGQSDDSAALPICEWRVEGASLDRAKVGPTIIGLAYSFGLSLLETAGDTFPLMSVDLVCRFEPADGREPVERQEVHKLQIGAGAVRIAAE
ncbi:MAG: hypothetical protein L0206_25675 [Actinobacteria bacterium]|nr:hypothetical protein [Actinomycetota bacterium]